MREGVERVACAVEDMAVNVEWSAPARLGYVAVRTADGRLLCAPRAALRENF